MEHDWVPFTEEMVICQNCGTVCNEVDAPESEWTAECTPDDLLYDKEDQ